MGKTAIWAISSFYPLPPLNNVEKQGAKLASSYVMGLQHCIGREGCYGFATLYRERGVLWVCNIV